MLLHSQHDVHLPSFGSYDLTEAFLSILFLMVAVLGSYQPNLSTYSFQFLFVVFIKCVIGDVYCCVNISSFILHLKCV